MVAISEERKQAFIRGRAGNKIKLAKQEVVSSKNLEHI